MLLANGLVMVAGGGSGDNWTTTNSARLWSPVSNTWTLGPVMSYGRAFFGLVALGDGTALAAGGCAGGCSGPNALGQYANQVGTTSERYTGSNWSGQANLTTQRSGVGYPVQLQDNRVLLCGGNDAFSTAYSSCDFYQPSTGVWTASGVALPDVNSRPMLLVGTKVLTLDQTGTKSYYWDPAADSTFTHAAPLPTPQPGGRMTLLAAGRVMLAGGYNGTTSAALTTVQIWTPATNTWKASASLGTGRTDPVIATLKDGRVLVAGGNGTAANNAQPLSSVELWSPMSLVWTSGASMLTARNSPLGVLLK